MIDELKAAFEAEMEQARRLAAAGARASAMTHLERAHVLGQYHVAAHVLVHCWMLRVALEEGRLGDVLGQGVRVVLGAIGSAIGRVPHGNTGGCNVNMFARMQVDRELEALVERDLAVAGRKRSGA